MKNIFSIRMLLLLRLVVPSALAAQFVESFSHDIRSMMMLLNDEWEKPAIMMLGGDDVINFSFDELSHSYHRYTYRVVLCNYDWTPSELLSVDYITGFNDLPIEDVRYSENPTTLYTNYSFSIPNEQLSLNLSGNYKVEVYDDESDEDEPVAVFGFLVVEHKVRMGVDVSGNTDIDYNDKYQQLNIIVDYSGYSVQSPSRDLKVAVSQNRRTDNEVICAAPTYVTSNRMEFVHDSSLIFKAGNEYRRFEVTDPYSPGMGVDGISYDGEVYNVALYSDAVVRSYNNTRDENGRYFINTNEGYGTVAEADYANVHFQLLAPYRSGGDYYLLGDYWGNGFSYDNMLEYDSVEGVYRTNQLMKFGVYNYMYVWLPDGSSLADAEPAEGSFYNTENEYIVKVYHREFGSRYDKLVGALVVKQ